MVRIFKIKSSSLCYKQRVVWVKKKYPFKAPFYTVAMVTDEFRNTVLGGNTKFKHLTLKHLKM